jgi:phage portal protein BeeE
VSLLRRSSTGQVERRAVSLADLTRAQSGDYGYSYSSADAFKIAAVVACVGLRAGVFAQLPLKGYRTGANGLAELLPVQPSLLATPSAVVVPAVWKTQMSISRDIWGYAVGRITAVDGAGYPSCVEWLPPASCTATQSFAGGPLSWRYRGSEIDSSLIFHVPSRWVMPGNPLGVSPLEYSGLVDLAKKAQDFGRDWFRNGAVPSSILYSEVELSGSQADDLSEKLTNKWRDRKIGVLDNRLKYEQVSVAANESQFLETMRQVAADIAISFNLPPEKINAVVSGQSVTYRNLDQNQQQFLIDSINPDLVVIQEVIESNMKRGHFPRWQTGAFLRSDIKTRYESYSLGIAAGVIQPNEARAWEDLPPIVDPVATVSAPKG